jgi:general nucleoside transport system permease protein
MRLERRERISAAWSLGAPFAAVAATLLASSLLVLWAGQPVAQTFSAIVLGGFGSVFAWSETLTRATPLLFTGLAAAVAFRAKLFNIGGEGQLYAGALAAVAVGAYLGAPNADGEGLAGFAMWLAFALSIAAAALAGAALLIVPAWLKLKLQVDEVVTTLLLNFIVLLGVGALLDGAMKDPSAMGWPQSVALPAELELRKLIEQTRLHTGLLIGAVLALVVWVLMKFMVLGLHIRAVGANARAAEFAGFPVTRTVVITALISGALAGMGGAIEVMGRTSYVTLDMSPGYGYSGIVVAMLAGLHPLGVVAASVFVAGMLVGADSMSRVVGVPTYIADVIVAASLISMLIAVMLTQYRLRWR